MLNKYALCDHRTPDGKVGPARRVIGEIELTPEEAANLNKALVTTPFRIHAHRSL